jgi:hypothetical protein
VLPANEPVALLVLEDERGNLRFLVHPDLRQNINYGDLPYIESLLMDFIERAKLHPEQLLQQLGSLAVGPLVTAATGSHLAEFPKLLQLCSRFVRPEHFLKQAAAPSKSRKLTDA